jgi:maltooligosyltrehalose synthase
VVVLTRTPSRHVEGWEDTTLTLPPGSYRDVLRASSSGAEPPTHSGTIALSVLLDERPIALLERVP